MGNVSLTGGDLGDVLRAGSGDDTLNGGAGNDVIEGGLGANQIDGGSGLNTLSYANLSLDPAASFGIVLNLDGGYAYDAVSLSDTIANIQNVVGTSIADYLIGNGAANVFEGGAGNDTIFGAGGSDTVSYEHSSSGVTVNLASNVHTGGDAEGDALYDLENITGSRYADSLSGDAGANRLYGFGGADTLAGGEGDDVYLVRDVRAVVVEQAGEGADIVKSTVNYTLADNVERLVLVSNAIDGTGNAGANVIIGSAKDNVIDGKGGIDVLHGMGGDDTFSFSSALITGEFDRIVDFDAGDLIRLDSAIFSQLPVGSLSDDMFKNLDLGPQDANDRVLYDQDTGRLLYDADGRGGDVAKLVAMLNNHADLTASDFRIV